MNTNVTDTPQARDRIEVTQPHRLDGLFRPRSIALFGVSPDRTRIRGRILASVREGGFPGAIYPISRTHAEIDGLLCYPDVENLPTCPDLVILTVPAEVVPELLERCAKIGIKNAIVLSSGFSEQGDAAAAARETEMRRITEKYDLVVCGPNAEGFYNSALPLTATFSPTVQGGVTQASHGRGRVAIISQSGGIGFAIYDRGKRKGMDASYVVSLGNELGLWAADVIDYVLEDEDTAAIALFVEGLKSPRRFESAAARAAIVGKPLVVAKVGRSEEAASASMSHTATLAGAYQAYEGVFAHYGVTLVNDPDQLVDVANVFALSTGRPAMGKRVGILTASGGAGIWMTDLCAAAGLKVVELDTATREALDSLMPEYGSSQNPVDITAQGVAGSGYAQALEILAASPSIDVLVVACSMARPTVLEHDLENLLRLGKTINKPVVFCSYTSMHPQAISLLLEAGFPCTEDMPNAVVALAALANYRSSRQRITQRISAHVEPTTDWQQVLATDGPVLCEHRARRVLELAGMTLAPARLANSPEEAVACANDLGSAVALKLQSPDLVHKTDVGGVHLNIHGTEAVTQAYKSIVVAAKTANAAAQIDGVLVQSMASPGVEMVVGVSRDPDFGPMLMVGLGGIFVEVLRDVVFSPVPVSQTDAHALLDRLQGRAVLYGVRGEPPSDVEALVELLVSVSELASQLVDEVAEIDLNPVVVHRRGQGVSVLDALMIKVEKDDLSWRAQMSP